MEAFPLEHLLYQSLPYLSNGQPVDCMHAHGYPLTRLPAVLPAAVQLTCPTACESLLPTHAEFL